MPRYEEILALRCQTLPDDIECVVTIIDPEKTRLILSAQPEFIRSPGIVRGSTHPETGQVTDYLTDKDGKPLPGNQQRMGIWSFDDHIDNLERTLRQTGHGLVGFVGAGNLLMNRGVMGSINDGGLLAQGAYYVSGEGTWWDGQKPWERIYDSLVVWKEGSLSIAKLRYRRRHLRGGVPNDPSEFMIMCDGRDPGEDVAGSIKYAVSGQRIVEAGLPLDFRRLRDMAEDGKFYDLNHVLGFAWIDTQPNPEWGNQWSDSIVFGYRHFFADIAGRRQLDRSKIEAAMNGDEICLSIGEEVWKIQCNYGNREAFLDKLRDTPPAPPRVVGFMGFTWRGYQQQQSPPNGPGFYQFDQPAEVARVKFLPGVYRHNVIALTRKGLLLSIQILGTSLRCGITILGLSRLVADMKVIGDASDRVETSRSNGEGDPVVDAIILDNGGDVLLNYATMGKIERPIREETWRVKSEAGRQNLRALLMFVEEESNANRRRPTPARRRLDELLSGHWQPSGGMIWYG